MAGPIAVTNAGAAGVCPLTDRFNRLRSDASTLTLAQRKQGST